MNFNPFIDISATKKQVLALCQQGDFLQAKELLDPLYQNGSLDAQGFFLLGRINGQLGDFEEAVKFFQETVRLQPNSPEMHFALGVGLSKLGRFSEAEDCFKTVLQFDPTHLQAILELAIAEFSQQKLSEAEIHFQQAIDRDPMILRALMGLGRIYHQLSKPDFAINYFKRALEINPNIVDAHYHLGTIYLGQGQIELAEESYKKAQLADPMNVPVHMEMGQLYMTTNKIDLARESFQKALSIEPENLDAIACEAQLHEQLGDIKAAHDRIIAYINKGIRHVGIGILFAKICRHSDSCVAAANYLEDLLKDSESAAGKNSKIYFALGKLYDHLGEYDKAFSCFQKANDQKTDTFNSIEHAGCISTLIKSCDWNFFLQAPRSTQKTERPVFIVGMPRSGTTLTEQILSSHPEVYGAGEIITFPNIIMSLPGYLGAGTAYPDNLKKLSVDILDALASTYLAEINKLNDSASRVVDKTLANFLYLGLISLMFPNAKIIHCKRDPRDTCLSIYFQNFDESHNYATRLENLGFYYKEYERVMQHWKSMIKTPVYEVQYEELVANQEKISRELIDFVGLDWDERVLDFHKTKRSVVTASYDQVRQKMYTKSTQRWKNYEKHIGSLVNSLDL
ncbi:MAG: tetratricopeptide repeat protein [Gammaproteobacteria bacterium]|nr:tetratricopeptide repeat protein [Gammaproteobacteria bacterium]